MEKISWRDFTKVEIRVGTVLKAELFEEVRNPAYKMWVDFGEYGIKKTSAQLTKNYKPYELIGKQVVAVLNFPVKQIANIMSECLVLGAIQEDNNVYLLNIDAKVPNGTRIG